MTSPRAESPTRLTAEHAYRLWAPWYDSAANPLLTLEERCLTPVLERFAKGHIVDLGCGTGRWLRRLEQMEPASLTGVDASAAMLAEAHKKSLRSTTLLHSDCTATPLFKNSADLLLSSFVLSYLSDLERFAREARRIVRCGGWLVLSDVHPNAASYGWRRSFRTPEGLFEMETYSYDFAELFHVMACSGFRLEEMNEPCFGAEEEEIFRLAGKPDIFLQFRLVPAIYWARFAADSDRNT
ncbi:class I SAM-dependent DNA methyltransferase [Paracidobacterium acidisoli]|uniref:Class I SAM-dependent methyltransferase n=1 Tax=Paracidobacterium acidisoli TaxID=2303751 RepID=A0A372ILX1_9BACT|nr:class I SAM-dependent methyltransferase [Paracidobacterium acidisoli]MBT9332350.1 class I SAM-dependent methyltransferase [Paracidobacterium acidisoli]